MASVELNRLAQAVGQPVGEQVELHPVGCQLAQHDELVPAEATDGVLVANRALQPFPDGLQQLISGRVPEAVVDVLEPVQVDEERTRGHAWPARCPRDYLLGAVDHEGTVRQPRQDVVQRLM